MSLTHQPATKGMQKAATAKHSEYKETVGPKTAWLVAVRKRRRKDEQVKTDPPGKLQWPKRRQTQLITLQHDPYCNPAGQLRGCDSS